jgi:hypothetical protein
MLRDGFKKKEDSKPVSRPSQPTRNRLNPIYALPTIRDVRVVLSEAEKARGIPSELPIQVNGAMFLLTCQSDNLSKEPSWTLYEGEGVKQIWSYLNENLEMIENIVCMSISEKKDPASASNAAVESAPAAPAPPPEQIAPATPLAGSDAPYEPYARWGATNVGDPGQPATWDQGQAGWNGQQGAGWAQQGADPQWAANQWGQAPQSYPGQAYAGAPMPPANDPSNYMQSPFAQAPSPAAAAAAIADFAERLEKRDKVTIAELTMDPKLPPACVDAALKLQELVLKGHFNERVALHAFKLAMHNGGVLDESILTKAKSSAGLDPDELARQAARLLQQAGLMTERQLLDCERTMAANGNSFLKAVGANGSIDKILFRAAQDCYPHVASGRMRPEQAMIAMNYCARSRTSFEDAASELKIDLSL